MQLRVSPPWNRGSYPVGAALPESIEFATRILGYALGTAWLLAVSLAPFLAITAYMMFGPT